MEKASATRRSHPKYNMVRTVNDIITENSEKFMCGCEKFDKFVALHESDIACELNANSPQADCDLRSEHCGSMLHYLTTCAMTSVLHDNGFHLYEVLENKFETSKSNYSTLLESPSTLTDISQMRKTPRSQEASNQGASTSRYRAATNFFTPSTSTQERVVNPNIVHDMPHEDTRSQKQQDKDERTLCLDELHHKDMEYQLKITHVEYIDRDTRGISLLNYDLKKHSTFRKRKQFWIAYAGSDIRVVHEDFFSQHYIDDPDKERLFRDTWVHSTIQDNANKKLPLTIQQKQNIIKMAKATGYHPKDRIAYIRRDVDDNKFVWKAKTEANIEVIVDDAWVELNLMNPHCQWYNNTIAQQLTNEDINNPEKNRWV